MPFGHTTWGRPPGGTVSAHLVGDALPVEDAHAPQAVLARSRQGDLSADNELVAHIMHVHSDINVGKEESAGKLLNLIALGKRVHTPREQLVRHNAGVIKKAAAPPRSPHPTSAPYRLPA